MKTAFVAALIATLMNPQTMVLAAKNQQSPLLADEGVPVSVPGTCNSVVFAQVPAHLDYFLGRLGNTDHWPQTCADNRAGGALALFRMDWNTHTLKFQRFVLQGQAQISAGSTTATVSSAYDPSIMSYNGELWVAFECVGERIPGAGSCMGPLDWNRGIIDTSRTTLVVAGEDAGPNSRYVYSASVPNVFVYQGKPYVYWSAIQALKAGLSWLRITIRGIQLVQEKSGLRRFWGSGSGGRPVPSYDPPLNVQVVGLPRNDPDSNQSADLKGLYATGGYVYVIAGVGGKGERGDQKCLNPGGTSYGCMRLRIYRSATPLGTDVFSASMLTSPPLPMNPADYQRPCITPQDRVEVIGEFFHPKPTVPYPQGSVLALRNGGLLIYPFDVPSFKFTK